MSAFAVGVVVGVLLVLTILAIHSLGVGCMDGWGGMDNFPKSPAPREAKQKQGVAKDWGIR